MSTARLYDIRLVLVVDGCDAAFLEHHVEICVFPNSLGLALHLFFLIVFRSPNLGKTMFDFLPRRLTTLPFFALLDFAVVSISIAAGTRRKSASAVPHVYHLRGAGRYIFFGLFSYCRLPSAPRRPPCPLPLASLWRLPFPSLVPASAERQARVTWLRGVPGELTLWARRRWP